jgi:hypothetical protein
MEDTIQPQTTEPVKPEPRGDDYVHDPAPAEPRPPTVRELQAEIRDLKEQIEALECSRGALEIPKAIIRSSKIEQYLKGYMLAEAGQPPRLSTYPDADEAILIGYIDGLRKQMTDQA